MDKRKKIQFKNAESALQGAQVNTTEALTKGGVQALLDIIRTAPNMNREILPHVKKLNMMMQPEEWDDPDAFQFLDRDGGTMRYYHVTIGDGIKFGPSAVWVDGKKVLDIPKLQQQTVVNCYYQRRQELQNPQKEQEVQDTIKLMQLRANVSEK